MANVVGDRYQITIDRKVREQLGIHPGDLAIERAEGGRLIVDFVPRVHDESLLGIFRRPGIPPITDWSTAKDRAWAVRSAEIMGALREEAERHRADEPPR